MDDPTFDQSKANRAIKFIESLKHPKGRWASESFKLLKWQKDLISELFGRVNPDTGYRQYRTCYIEIPKKNGKSALASAVALILLCADDEQGAEVYSGATDRDQAAIVFNVSAQMVRAHRQLNERLKIINSQKRIVDYETNSFYRVLSSEAFSKHGFNISGCVIDELHAHQDREFMDVLTQGAGDARTQPLTFIITTAGFDRNSIGFEYHDYALKVKNGIIEDPSFLPIIYAVDNDADWKDEKEWIKANPSLGHIFDIESLRKAYKEATEKPSLENVFRRLRLNQWTSSETRWLDIEKWDSCSSPVNPDTLVGRNCYGGMDLSSTTDITCFALLFEPQNGDGVYDLMAWFWVPGDNIDEKSRQDRVPYNLWQRNGLVEATEGNVIDYSYIRNKINELGKKYWIREIGYDPWNATQLAIELQNDGYLMVPVRQGYASLSSPTKELLKMVLAGKIRHGGNPVLRYMVDSMMVTQDAAGNIKPAKDKSTSRIDGIVASIIALDRASRNGPMTSIYNTRGIIMAGEEITEPPKEEVEAEAIPQLIDIIRCERCSIPYPILTEFCTNCGQRLSPEMRA